MGADEFAVFGVAGEADLAFAGRVAGGVERFGEGVPYEIVLGKVAGAAGIAIAGIRRVRGSPFLAR